MCTLIRNLGFKGNFFSLFSWMFQSDGSTLAVLSVLHACFVFLYMYLLSAIEHVSHGKVL